MYEISSLVKILFQVFGCILIAVSMYFIMKIYPFSDFRNYTYITKQERNRRSLRAGIGSVGVIFGLLFLIFPTTSQDIKIFELLLEILSFGLCISLVVALLTIFRMYRDLGTYTKMDGDIVSTDEDRNTKK